MKNFIALVVSISPDMGSEDGLYVAEVPSLPGCISQGKTTDEALENIKEAIALYLEPDDDIISLGSGQIFEVTV